MHIIRYFNPDSSPSGWRGLLRITFIGWLAAAASSSTVHAAPKPAPLLEREYQAWGQATNQNVTTTQNGCLLAVDSRGNVAITSVTLVNNVNEYYTAEYDSANGELLWDATVYTGVADCTPTAIAVDSAGDVVVTGGYDDGSGTNEDIYTVKYAGVLSTTHVPGTELWHARYNDVNDGADEGTKVVTDSSNNVIVTGKAIAATFSQNEIYTAKYNGTTGALIWSSIYFGSAHAGDEPAALAVNGDGDIAVAGVTNDADFDGHFVTIKINSTGTVQWDSFYNSPVATSYVTATGVAIDSAGNVVVTGVSSNVQGTEDFYTAEYKSTGGGVLWDVLLPANNINGAGPAGVALDSLGNPVVTGTYNNSGGTPNYMTVKYGGAADVSPGEVLWQNQSSPPGGNFGGDMPIQVVVDGADSAVVTGTSTASSGDINYYTVKYDTNGVFLWDNRFDDNAEFGGSGVDTANSVAADLQGNVVVTGVANLPMMLNGQDTGTFLNQGYTVKINRVIAAVGDLVPDNAGFTYSALGTPAIADSGAVVLQAKVTENKKTMAAILYQSAAGVTSIVAMEGGAAPGTAGKYASFTDPVMSPNGAYAFTAKVSGIKGSMADVLYSNLDGGADPGLLMQEGTQVSTASTGSLLKSIESISMTNGDLWALLKVSGKGVTGAEGTVLVDIDINNGASTNSLQTGEASNSISFGAASVPVKSIMILDPSKGSPGQGRWTTLERSVALVDVIDKTAPKGQAIFELDDEGDFTTRLYTGEAISTAIAQGGTWTSFGFPTTAEGTEGIFYATLGKFQIGKSVPKDDTALVFSSDGVNFSPFAVQGQAGPVPAAGQTSTYSSFLDPLVNNDGDVAFVTTLGVSTNGGKAKSDVAICWGPGATPASIQVVAGIGDTSVDTFGNPGTGNFSQFESLALPDGPLAGPIFLAKVSGKGVTSKNDLGIWAINIEGALRQVLRLGDTLGTATVTGITLLQADPGVSAAGRSYNANGTAAAYVTLSDKTEELIHVDLP